MTDINKDLKSWTPEETDEKMKAAIEKRIAEEAKKRYQERTGKKEPQEDLSKLSPEERKSRTEKRVAEETERLKAKAEAGGGKVPPDPEEEVPGQKELAGLSTAEIKRRTELRIVAESDLRKAEAEGRKVPAPEKIDSKFVLDCLGRNETGDGILYTALHRGKHIFSPNDGEWFRWAGHYWEKDHMNTALSDVENVSRRYLEEAINIAYLINDAVANGDTERVRELGGLREKINKRVMRLRTQRGRQNCLSFASTQQGDYLAVLGDSFDMDPWAFACKNGVLDLRTGNIRPGRPEDLILRACPHDWKGIDEPAPHWQEFLQSTFDDETELISFVQRYFGYSLTGLNLQRKFGVLHGRGANGKGVFVETMYHVLGSHAAPIASEMLLDQGRARSSAAPSPDILALKGLRLAVASESDEGRKFSVSRVKWLCSSDKLVGRSPHARNETYFSPSHKLFLQTNSKPHASSTDFAFWERMLLIPFSLSFVSRTPRAPYERRADLYLQEKLREEASGILAWLVKGCISWQERGLDPPAIVLDATQEYRNEEDILEEWIEEECFRDPDAKAGASELYDSFVFWFEKNVSKRGMSQRKFGRLMRSAGFEKVKSGTFTYHGLGLLAG